MPVIDTNVFAYALFGEAKIAEPALSILSEEEIIIVPDSMFAELANVAWQYVKNGHANHELADAALADTLSLVDVSVPASDLAARALELSIAHDHPAYDTLFVAAAEIYDTYLTTFDRRLAERFELARFAGET